MCTLFCACFSVLLHVRKVYGLAESVVQNQPAGRVPCLSIENLSVRNIICCVTTDAASQHEGVRRPGDRGGRPVQLQVVRTPAAACVVCTVVRTVVCAVDAEL
jgi:hypothetical protein